MLEKTRLRWERELYFFRRNWESEKYRVSIRAYLFTFSKRSWNPRRDCSYQEETLKTSRLPIKVYKTAFALEKTTNFSIKNKKEICFFLICLNHPTTRHIKYKVIKFAPSFAEITIINLHQQICHNFSEQLYLQLRNNSAKYIARYLSHICNFWTLINLLKMITGEIFWLIWAQDNNIFRLI